MRFLYITTACLIYGGGAFYMSKMAFHPAYIVLWLVVIGNLIGVILPD
jgi:hypothetical protein